MNKKMILLTALMATATQSILSSCDNQPARIFDYESKGFGGNIIDFNGSEKTIGKLIADGNEEFSQVPYLHQQKDGSFKDLGTVGSPQCHHQFDPIAAIVAQLRMGKKGGWCGTANAIFVTELSTTDSICNDCTNYLAMVCAASKKSDIVERKIEQTSQ